MPAVSVNIQPEIINWAVSQADEGQLGAKLMDNIKHWLDGTKTPTFKQIEDLSRKTRIPLGYFFLQKPPVEEIKLLEYRTIDSIDLADPSRDLIDTIKEMELVQDWMKEYRQDTGFDILNFVGSLKGQSDAFTIADQIRRDLDLEPEWYKNCYSLADSFNFIRVKLNECGVIVMLNGIVGKNTHRALSIDEFRAFAMVDDWAPLIFINNADSQGAKLFSLFHEIAHIWLGEDDLYNDRRHSNNVKPLEVLCNAVAGELMVPVDAFKKEWKDTSVQNRMEKITILARKFRCGESVIARKALDCKKINKALYEIIINEAIDAYKTMRENGVSSGGNYYNTTKSRLDSCFIRALCESIASGRTTYSEAYRLTNTSRKTFEKVALRHGGIV